MKRTTGCRKKRTTGMIIWSAGMFLRRRGGYKACHQDQIRLVPLPCDHHPNLSLNLSCQFNPGCAVKGCIIACEKTHTTTLPAKKLTPYWTLRSTFSLAHISIKTIQIKTFNIKMNSSEPGSSNNNKELGYSFPTLSGFSTPTLSRCSTPILSRCSTHGSSHQNQELGSRPGSSNNNKELGCSPHCSSSPHSSSHQNRIIHQNCKFRAEGG